MVSFTKNSIVITVETTNSPFYDWQMMNKSLSELLLVLMSNKVYPISDWETHWLIELKSALCELDIDNEQTKQIEKLLAVA